MSRKTAARVGVLFAASFLTACMSTDRPTTEQAEPTTGGPVQTVRSLIESLRTPEPAATPAPTVAAPVDCGDGTDTPVFTGRVVAAGDSLGQGLMQILTNEWSAVSFTNLTTNSSGLARPDFYDTVGHFNQAVAEQAHPGDIAVIWLGANDNQSLTNTDGSVAVYISHEDEWDTAYGARISAMARTCVSYRIDCYWLAPAASDASATEHVGHRSRMGVIRGLLYDVVDSDPAFSRSVHIVDVWSVRDEHPGWDFAHPGMSGFIEAAGDVASSIAQTKGVCMA
jgi:hypothetical protein